VPELLLVRINRVQLSGRATRDVVLRYAPDGTPVATFTVAFNRYVRENSGWREIPGFVGAVVSGTLAERCAEKLRRGSALYLEGRLQTRQYRASDGRTRNLIEIRADAVQFLEREAGEPDEDATAAGTRAAARPQDAGELFPDAEGEREVE
jgi:single-strand DNA-binding protein